MGQWSNDANNWQRKWEISNQISDSPAVCLMAEKLAGTAIVDENNEDLLPWQTDMEIENSAAKNNPTVIESRLWSPKLPAKIGMKCLTLYYVIYMGEGRQTSQDLTHASLSLLQRQTG